MRRLAPPILALAIALLALSARAQPSDADRATAQALFSEARSLMANGEHAKACPKLEESQRLEPALGTQLNLAGCYEKIGRTASAWQLFREVAAASRAAGQNTRAKVADEEARTLEPRLSKIVIVVTAPRAGLTVKRDGELVAEATWGKPIPVDPGSHQIVAMAPGREPWKDSVVVQGEGALVTVKVPALAPLGAEAPSPEAEPGIDIVPTPEPGAADDGPSPWVVAGGIMIGLGAGALVVGGVFLARAQSKSEESVELCSGSFCDPAALELHADAVSAQNAAVALFVTGGVVAAAGIVMTVIGATSSGDAEVALVPAPGGMHARVCW